MGDMVQINFSHGTIEVGKQKFQFEALPDKLMAILEKKGLVNWIKSL